MKETLKALEERRRQLYRQLEAVGDLRRGIISVNYRKCGKANCACARRGHRGHGPQYLWNTTVDGKSRSANVRLGPELEKVQQEIGNYRRFVGLTKELVEVNEAICQKRPARGIEDQAELEALKKTLSRQFGKRSKRKLGTP
jgi:hypothetical protein